MIDRYVIDTHPTPVFDPLVEDIPVEQLPTNEEEEEMDEVVEESVVVAASAPIPRQQQPVEDEPEVLHSSSSFAAEEPVSCVEPVEAVEQHRTYEQEEDSEEELEEVEEPAVMATSTPARQQQRVADEPEALNASFWNPPNEPVTCDDQILEQEFTAALQGDEIDDANKFSPELLSRSLEQPKTESGKKKCLSTSNQFIRDPKIVSNRFPDAKVRMSTSKTPPSSPFEAVEAFTRMDTVSNISRSNFVFISLKILQSRRCTHHNQKPFRRRWL